MSINENKEFEAINQKTRERTVNESAVCHSTEEIYRVKKAKTTKKAIVCMVAITLALAAAVVGISALEVIGWINGTFKGVLLCAAGCVAMFNQGYFWHEIKN